MKNASLGIVGLIALGAVVLVPSYAFTKLTEKEIVAVVSSKDRECVSKEGGTDCRYVVYTTEEVFENKDSWWNFKFNSSDVHNKLVPGQSYKLTVYGWRVPFFSWYRNIVKVEPNG